MDCVEKKNVLARAFKAKERKGENRDENKVILKIKLFS